MGYHCHCAGYDDTVYPIYVLIEWVQRKYDAVEWKVKKVLDKALFVWTETLFLFLKQIAGYNRYATMIIYNILFIVLSLVAALLLPINRIIEVKSLPTHRDSALAVVIIYNVTKRLQTTVETRMWGLFHWKNN